MKVISIILILVLAISTYPQTDEQQKTYHNPVLLEKMTRVHSVSYSVSGAGYSEDLKPMAEDYISSVLKLWDIEIKSAEADGYLHVVVGGSPIAREYVDWEKHYTGAEVEGTVYFRIKGVNVFEKSFHGKQYPSDFIHSSSSYKYASDAPFKSAFLSSDFKSILLNLTAHKVGLGKFIRVAVSLHLSPSPDRLLGLVQAANNPNEVLAELIIENSRRNPNEKLAVLSYVSSKILEIVLYIIEMIGPNEAVAHELLSLATDTTMVIIPDLWDTRKIPCIEDAIKTRAIDLLAQLKYKQGVEELIVPLKFGTNKVRESSANALGEIGDERALEPLMATLVSTRNERILEATYAALRSISKEVFGDDEEQWVLWWESSTGREVVAYDDKGMSPLLLWIIVGILAVIIAVGAWWVDNR